MLILPQAEGTAATEPAQAERLVAIGSGSIGLDAELWSSRGARGLVAFLHGSGSSHKNPRDRFVARALQQRGFAVLLFDPLTRAERRLDAADERLRFDVRLLAQRLILVSDWLRAREPATGLPIAYLGAGVGAAAVLVAAAERPELVGAVACRGGRPDLAGAALSKVRAPTLILLRGGDPVALQRAEHTRRQLPGSARLATVPGGSDAFDDASGLSVAAELAADWYAAALPRVAVQATRHA